jgi:predicted TIM-barrel fold metal-dependent hydrolase
MTGSSNVTSVRRPDSSPLIFRMRKPSAMRSRLPGLRLVSADNHLCLGGEDVWYERVPVDVRARIPRVWYDVTQKRWVTGFDGKSLYPFGTAEFISSMEGREGSWNVDARTADLAAEGVEKEIAFPQVIPWFFHYKDLVVRDWIFRGYNDYLADLQRRQPGHFYGVAIPNYWDVDAMAHSVETIASLGLKTLMLPGLPGRFPDGSEIRYADPKMEPLWAAIEGSGLPVCFHIGEQITVEGRGGLATTALYGLAGSYFRRNFGDLVFGGIFDRHPKLRVVFAEAGIHWVPGMLQDAEMILDSFTSFLDHTPAKRPSEYWSTQCYATFMHDPAGLSMIDRIGARNVMWSVDYMHSESTFGYSADVVDEIIASVGEQKALEILGATAIEVFDLD